MNSGYLYEIREHDWFYRRLEPDVGYSVLRYLQVKGQEPMLVGRRFFETLGGAQDYVKRMEERDKFFEAMGATGM